MKPLLVLGNGIRLSGEQERIKSFVQRWQIPFVSTWTGADLIPTNHPLNTGILGMSGQAGANKAVQECEHLIAIGTHLAIPHTTTLTGLFAKKAKISVINVDPDQISNMNVRVDNSFVGTVSSWLDTDPHLPTASEEWKDRCSELKKLNEIGNPKTSSGINSYVFNDLMTRMLPPGTSMVIDGGGTALYTGFQSSHIKEGSRLICSTSMSAMGSGLPEAVGACFAQPLGEESYGEPKGYRMTTCLIGDGSLMLNLQELQTIRHHHLPIKIFVINNRGYLAIKHTQDGFLEGRHFGVGDGDLSWPRVENVARAFDIPFLRVSERRGAEEIIGTALEVSGPIIVEVLCPQDQEMRWKQGFKKEGDRFIPQTLDEMQSCELQS